MNRLRTIAPGNWKLTLGLVGASLLLVAVILFAVLLLVQRDDAAQAHRDEIRKATVAVIIDRCHSENVLRTQLRDLVVKGRDNLQQYYKRGLITRDEYRETIEDQNDALRKLRDKNCVFLARRFSEAVKE